MISRRAAVAILFLVFSGPVHPATLCVWTNSPHPGAPYNAWTNAARDIQAAVDAAQPGDTVLVTNGTYASGNHAMPAHLVGNRVMITTSIVVRSVNGPAVTVIRGRNAGESVERRCVYIAGGGQLSGFTLTNGAARGGSAWQDGLGGGALLDGGGVISNCVVSGNIATYGGGIAGYYGGEVRNCFVFGNAGGSGSWFYGGGFYGAQGAAVYDSVFSNNTCEIGGGVGFEGGCRAVRCVMINNQAVSGGGLSLKADFADNCLIVSNVASRSGGGIAFSSGYGLVRNCTVVGNVAQLYPDRSGTYHVMGGTLVNSILVGNGNGSENLDASLKYTADHLCTTPLPSNGTGHVTADPLLLPGYCLSSDSPCIDAGCTNGPDDDFARVPRPLDGNRDGTNTWDIGAFEYVHALADSDGDGMGDDAELRAGTEALDPASFLFVQAGRPAGADSGFVVSWPGVSGKRYRLERATNASPSAFTHLVRTNILGINPMNVETDKTASGSGPWLYRVKLE